MGAINILDTTVVSVFTITLIGILALLFHMSWMVTGFTAIFLVAVLAVAVGLPWLSLQNDYHRPRALRGQKNDSDGSN